MAGKSTTVLITGGNTGIGFQIVRALCASDQPYSIILAGRSADKVDQAITSAQHEFLTTTSKLHPLQIDIEHDDSIKQAFATVSATFDTVDVLVNNAGVQLDGQFIHGKVSERDMWQQSWNVNTVGAQVLTSTFMPLLLASSAPRLLFVASGTSSMAGMENMAIAVNHHPEPGWPKPGFHIPAYRSAKAGLNMMMREWHRMLKNDGVKVWAVSPGFLATGLGMGNPEAMAKMGAQDPTIAGAIFRGVIEGKRDADVGKVVLKEGVQPY